MRILDRGQVFDAATAPREARFCTFPSVARAADSSTARGKLIVSFRTGSAKDSADEDSRVMVSEDAGKTWQTVCVGFGDIPPGRGRARSLGITTVQGKLLGALGWVDRSDPSLPLFNAATEGILPTRALVTESVDGGHTWAAYRQVPQYPHTGNAMTGSILVLADGRLALPYEAWKDYYDTAPGRHHASLRLSADGGVTWPELSIVAHDPSGRVLYWDQRLGVAPDTGELIALFWTHDRQVGRDLAIHSARTTAGSLLWTEPVSTGIAGQIASPLCLGGGRVFAAYVHRHHPPSLRAVLSDDFGRTWTAASELVFYEKATGVESGMAGNRDFADYWADMSIWTFGHPTALALPGGDVFVVYYAGDPTAMGIHWVRIGLD